MIHVPGVVSNHVWDDLGLGLSWELLHALTERSRKDLISRGLEGLLMPFLLVAGVVLLNVPGVVSLFVWLDP